MEGADRSQQGALGRLGEGGSTLRGAADMNRESELGDTELVRADRNQGALDRLGEEDRMFLGELRGAADTAAGRRVDPRYRKDSKTAAYLNDFLFHIHMSELSYFFLGLLKGPLNTSKETCTLLSFHFRRCILLHFWT